MESKAWSLNGYVFTEPFSDKGLKVQNTGGFSSVAQKKNLTALKVVYNSDTIPKDCFIYVRGDSFKQPWALEVFELDGQKVIAVPQNFIMLASTQNLINGQ